MAATHAHQIARISREVSELRSVVEANNEALARLIAHIDADAPAKTSRKAAVRPKAAAKPAKRKPARKPAAPKAPTKGIQTRETLSRKEWNRTLTAKARLAGGDAYKRVLAQWDTLAEARETLGMTPDMALEYALA